MYEFFISYSRKDTELIKPLLKVLEDNEISKFIDINGIEYGGSYTNKIQKALLDSRKVILIWTPNSEDSKWVDKEIQFAITKDIPIVPIRIGNFEPKGWELALSNLNWCEVDELTENNSLQIINKCLEDSSNEETISSRGKRISTRKYIKGGAIKRKEEFVDVFISCTKFDKSLAHKISRGLKRRGLSTYIDESAIKNNNAYKIKVAKIINNAKAFLLLLTENSMDSPDLFKELEYAEKKGKEIVIFQTLADIEDQDLKELLEGKKIIKLSEGKSPLRPLLTYVNNIVPTDWNLIDEEDEVQEIFFNDAEIEEDYVDENEEGYKVNEDIEDPSDDLDIVKLETLEKLSEAVILVVSLPGAVIRDIKNLIFSIVQINKKKKKRKSSRKKAKKIMKNHRRQQRKL